MGVVGAIASSMAVDGVPLFFGFTAVFRGWPGAAAWERVKAEYVGTLRSLWAFWTPICVFVFAVLPVRHQVK